MVHEMKLDREPYEKMKSGSKTVELRIFDDKRRCLEIDDIVIFTERKGNDRKIATRITALYRYRTFEKLFSEIAPAKCGFAKHDSIEDAVKHMRGYYPLEKELETGILGIRVELMNYEDAVLKQISLKEAEFDRLFPDGMK